MSGIVKDMMPMDLMSPQEFLERFSAKPTKADIEWANQKIKEHKSQVISITGNPEG